MAIIGKKFMFNNQCMKIFMISGICDPLQQKVHLVSQVGSEIMSKIVCKIYRKSKETHTL